LNRTLPVTSGKFDNGMGAVVTAHGESHS
jgi:hypothetical protein